MQFVEVKNVAANGVTIVSREWNMGTIGTVVFIHGLGADQRQFESDASFFSEQGYNAVTVDLRGHGCSSTPHPLSQETLTVGLMAEDLLTILDRVADGPLHLVGNSLGGLVALELCNIRADRVTTLATFGTAYSLRLPTVISTLGYWFGKLVGNRKLGQLIAKTATQNKAARAQLAQVYYRPNLPLIQFIHRNVCKYNFLSVVKAYSGQILMICGAQDSVVNTLAARSVRALTGDPKFSKVVVANAGHFTNLDQPEKLRKILVSFWDKSN
ncbi:MAG: alpha/beta hydrolase [Sulfitobacter sp.]